MGLASALEFLIPALEQNIASRTQLPSVHQDTLTREGSARPTIHYSPYDSLPTITSYIHPYYAICNVSQKDAKHHADRQIATWLQTKPDPPAYLAPPPRSTRSSQSAHSGSSSEKDHSCTKQRIRRAKLVDGSKSALVVHREDEDEQDDEAQESYSASTASTPEELQSVTDEKHTYDCYRGQAVVSFQSKVGQWLTDQQSSISRDEPGLAEEFLGLLPRETQLASH
ncbi:hypothetical protein RHS01_10251 [Rhizoctonia solani]|uniref:Uncharacterized protein n=1 Tax=Rhizoctonia solani TaxID=456999 RepID=A0A8H7I2Q8_9AGAM|nr:hypothetical protein RHS01_10437 [Rhizoctonia solani]KAF8749277.1 hypothetical protein RHS01_10251 [Rhizoctonia solani]